MNKDEYAKKTQRMRKERIIEEYYEIVNVYHIILKEAAEMAEAEDRPLTEQTKELIMHQAIAIWR